jgi:hypothetical protein
MSSTAETAQITCLDDVPTVAHVAAQQEFLHRWYRLVAIIPFMVVLFVVTKFFGKSSNPFPVAVVFASLVWAGAIVGYTIYLRFALRCPVCGWRFGVRDKCSSCGLLRHADPNAAGDVLSIT